MTDQEISAVTQADRTVKWLMDAAKHFAAAERAASTHWQMEQSQERRIACIDAARRLTSQAAQPGEMQVREIATAAFVQGALAVHNEWLTAHEQGEGPPRGDPEFGEAANDYAAALASHPLTTNPVDDSEAGVGCWQGLINQREFFEAGYIACWSEMFVKSNCKPAYPIGDATLDRAWDIYLATHPTQKAQGHEHT